MARAQTKKTGPREAEAEGKATAGLVAELSYEYITKVWSAYDNGPDSDANFMERVSMIRYFLVNATSRKLLEAGMGRSPVDTQGLASIAASVRALATVWDGSDTNFCCFEHAVRTELLEFGE